MRRLFSEAEALLLSVLEDDPNNFDLLAQLAGLAERQENWKDAAAYWSKACALRPDDANLRNAYGTAAWTATMLEMENGDLTNEQHDGADVVLEKVDVWKQLALRFEGLGDACEFGVIQRQLGAEPIGLFRFAAISASSVASLLDDHLNRIGDPDFTELGLTPADEFLIRDKRGFFHMHTFVKKGSVEEGKFLRSQTTRLGYLKRKLIEDLEEGEKVFVHKSSLSRISDDVAIELHNSLERYGRNLLLVIRSAEEDRPAGSIAIIRDRLLVGHLSNRYGQDPAKSDLVSWRSILMKAVKYKQEIYNC